MNIYAIVFSRKMVFCCWVVMLLTVARLQGSEQDIAQVDSQVPESAVIGLPLTVTHHLQGEWSIPIAHPWGEGNAFGITLKTEELVLVYPGVTNYRMRLSQPRSILSNSGGIIGRIDDVKVPIPKFEVGNNHSASFTVDLSDRPTLVDNRVIRMTRETNGLLIKPGKYLVRIDYGRRDIVAKTFTLELIKPNPIEKTAIAYVQKKRAWIVDRNDSNDIATPLWPVAVLFWPEVNREVDLNNFSNNGKKQLALYEMLATLVHSGVPLSQTTINEDLVKIIPEGEGGIVAVARLELAHARGDRKQIEAIISEIARKYPQWNGLAKQIVESGRGLIESFRSRRVAITKEETERTRNADSIK